MSEQHQLYINGEWIETDASVANTSPSDTTDVIGHYAQASTAQVEAAITAASAAVLEWGASPLETRYSLLMDTANTSKKKVPKYYAGINMFRTLIHN